jgi:clorobiocin/coumermycin A biosynthesis protein CloN7/CouN7
VTPDQQADDLHRLLAELGGAPADVFGSSGGAVAGLVLVTAHPQEVRMLVAHEPPVHECLPDRAQLRAAVQDMCDIYRADGADKAIGKFLALGAPDPQWEPSPEQLAQWRAAVPDRWAVFFARWFRPWTFYQPDIAALRGAPTRIVVAAGAESTGQQVPNRAARALAGQLGTRVVEFPGDHGGYVALPERVGRLLDEVFTQTGLTGRA